MKKAFVSLLSVFALASCVDEFTPAKSALGVYKLDGHDYWVSIYPNGTYRMCSAEQCFDYPYGKTQVKNAIVLHDFYANEVGLSIEAIAADNTGDKVFAHQRLIQSRMESQKPNAKIFVVAVCTGGVPCAEEGDIESPIRFFQVINLDKYQ